MVSIPDKPVEDNFYRKFKRLLKKFGITIAEWHSLVVGSCGALIGGPQLAVAMWVLITSGVSLSGHLKDVKKEFGYFLASFSVIEYTPQVVKWLISLL